MISCIKMLAAKVRAYVRCKPFMGAALSDIDAIYVVTGWTPRRGELIVQRRQNRQLTGRTKLVNIQADGTLMMGRTELICLRKGKRK